MRAKKPCLVRIARRTPPVDPSLYAPLLKTLGRYILTGEGATKQLKGVTPPLIRLRAQNHRIFFRDHGDYLKIERVLDRKEAYR
jgi:hypothetical protein